MAPWIEKWQDDANRRSSTIFYAAWGDNFIHTDGTGPKPVPRTRRQRIADWWVYHVVLRVEGFRTRLARRIYALADWVDPYGY